MKLLDDFHAAPDELARNRLIARWIEDDTARAEFYDELRASNLRTLRFRSL